MLATIYTCALASYILYPLILMCKYRIADCDDGSAGKMTQLMRIFWGLYVGIFWLPWIMWSLVGSIILTLILFIAAFGAAVYVFHIKTNPQAGTLPRLDGKTVLLTGGNRGVGLGTAKVYARHGANLYITSRTADKGKEAVLAIKEAVPGAKVDYLVCDMDNMESVDQCADAFLAKSDKLDILLLNAGIGHRNVGKGDGKIDSIIYVNALAPARLLMRLTELLEKSGGAVIMTSSVVGRGFFTEFPDAETLLYDWKTPNRDTLVCYGGYGRSKALQALFIQGYAKTHPKVRAYSMHPGTVSTDMPLTIWGQLQLYYPAKVHWIMQPLFEKSLRLIWMHPETSGLISLHAATAPKNKLPSGSMLNAAPLTPYTTTMVHGQADHAEKVYKKVIEYIKA